MQDSNNQASMQTWLVLMWQWSASTPHNTTIEDNIASVVNRYNDDDTEYDNAYDDDDDDDVKDDGAGDYDTENDNGDNCADILYANDDGYSLCPWQW